MSRMIFELEDDLTDLMTTISRKEKLANPALMQLFWDVKSAFGRKTPLITTILVDIGNLLNAISDDEFDSNVELEIESRKIQKKMNCIRQAQRKHVLLVENLKISSHGVVSA
ncbi:MAG: hypothetical protein JST16_02840 [Bdellovibrionales bacterium]|nr:hypothetical protein [Bdellovibrionales bacterium]